jgi:hypothetical protein
MNFVELAEQHCRGDVGYLNVDGRIILDIVLEKRHKRMRGDLDWLQFKVLY